MRLDEAAAGREPKPPGGYGAVAPLPAAEVYGPETGTFSPAG